jgi:hypothetical protein
LPFKATSKCPFKFRKYVYEPIRKSAPHKNASDFGESQPLEEELH